tara:strand:+ start:1570 stop:2010 length:441 start_codon:yes stop_codon:yes gene_type:complete
MMRSKVMWKPKNIFTGQKELPQLVLPLLFLVWFIFEITEYGHRPFVEGFIEDFTDPIFFYFFIGYSIVAFVIVYFLKRNKKNIGDEEIDKPNRVDKPSKNINGSITLIIILLILVMVLGYFGIETGGGWTLLLVYLYISLLKKHRG